MRFFSNGYANCSRVDDFKSVNTGVTSSVLTVRCSYSYFTLSCRQEGNDRDLRVWEPCQTVRGIALCFTTIRLLVHRSQLHACTHSSNIFSHFGSLSMRPCHGLVVHRSFTTHLLLYHTQLHRNIITFYQTMDSSPIVTCEFDDEIDFQRPKIRKALSDCSNDTTSTADESECSYDPLAEDHRRVQFHEEDNQSYDSPWVIIVGNTSPSDKAEQESSSALPLPTLPTEDNEIVKSECWYKRSDYRIFRDKFQHFEQRRRIKRKAGKQQPTKHQQQSSLLSRDEDFQIWLGDVNGMVWDFILS